MTHDAGSSESLLTQQGNTDIQEYWLSHQFNRIPFLLYKFWLILNFPIMLIMFLYLTYQWCYETFSAISAEGYLRSGTSLILSSLFFLYGCCQMLYAIRKEKPRVAQESFLKFQYGLISSGTVVIVSVREKIFEDLSVVRWMQWFYMVFSPVVHLGGGFAVVRVFKKNKSLARLHDSQASEEDFLKQNEMIASAVCNSDEKLNSWPYFIYKLLLKLSVILEIIFLLDYALPEIYDFWRMSELSWKFFNLDFFIVFFVIIWGISSLLNAYSCFQMEVATRTKNLAKAQRAIILFKICALLLIIKCFFVKKCLALDEMWPGKHMWWFAGSALGPVISLIGALKVKKILEERESFVKVSSYSEDAYI